MILGRASTIASQTAKRATAWRSRLSSATGA